MLFQTDKEYDFFAAISGARSRFHKPNLIKARGIPSNLSYPAVRYFDDHGDDLAGWLHPSEIDRCIRHVSGGTFYTDFDLDVMLEFMRRLTARLSDPHVRLVFNIEG